MSRVLTLFEYEVLDGLDADEIKVIARLSKAVGTDVLKPIVRQGRVCFQARQFVGIIRAGRRTLQILPKIHCATDSRDQRVSEASRNLLWMLDYVEGLNLKAENISSLQASRDLFEVLIHLFSTNLKRQWIKGAHRDYQPVDAVLPVLKGKWHIAMQMRKPIQKHQFSVTYDSFTADNILNQVFRYVVELLWKLTRDSANRQHLTDLRGWMDEVTLLPTIDLRYAQSTQLTRLNQRYEPLLNLSMLFLQGFGIELLASNLVAFAFVFDMNRLYESFLTGFIQRHKKEILPPALNHCHLLPQSKQAIVHLAQCQNQNVFRLKPDLVIRDHSSYPTVLDFKYKQLNPNVRRLGVVETDFYQMYAYLNRFNCSEVTLIYPQSVGMTKPVRSCFLVGDGSRRIRAVTINLLQDLTQKGAHRKLIAELRQILEEQDS